MKNTVLLFDLDGTLWDSAAEVAASWNEALAKEPEAFPPITVEDVHSVMGKTMEEIAALLFGAYSPKRRFELLVTCETNEVRHIAKSGGVLMPGVPETLAELKRRGYRMAVVSNCQTGYIDAFYQSMHTSEFFEDSQEWGSTHLPKGENIKIICERNGWTGTRENATEERPTAVYIGDTQGDCNASDVAGIPFYHAAYGFGTVTHCESALDSFGDLLKLFP